MGDWGVAPLECSQNPATLNHNRILVDSHFWYCGQKHGTIYTTTPPKGSKKFGPIINSADPGFSKWPVSNGFWISPPTTHTVGSNKETLSSTQKDAPHHFQVSERYVGMQAQKYVISYPWPQEWKKKQLDRVVMRSISCVKQAGRGRGPKRGGGGSRSPHALHKGAGGSQCQWL